MTGAAKGVVVVGVDGSDQSRDAIALGLTLAEPLTADLASVFVHPYGPLAGSLPESKYEEFVTELVDAVHAHMRAVELPVSQRKLRIVTDRSPAAGLQRTAEETRPALIVVGGSQRSRIGRVLPGGTAERLLAGSPCPVAIAPRGYAQEKQPLISVGCGFDGSSESRLALDWAADLARSAGAQLRLLSVHQHLPPVTVPSAGELPLASVNEQLRDALARQLADTEAELTASGLAVVGALLDGNPMAVLSRASVQLDALVLGSRGYGPFGAVLLGSVSNNLVRTTSCPLVVVPRPAKA